MYKEPIHTHWVPSYRLCVAPDISTGDKGSVYRVQRKMKLLLVCDLRGLSLSAQLPSGPHTLIVMLGE